MSEENKKRLEELKKTSNDAKLQKLFEEMVRLENTLDDLKECEMYRRNPNNPAEIKINPAFYAYHKTLGAYKEIIRVLLSNCEETTEESPLRAYLKTLHTPEENYE